jgi:hypothetical protein
LPCETYTLQLADSTRILMNNGDEFLLNTFPDSSKTSTDIITYNLPTTTELTKKIGKIDQQVVRQSDASTIEYYRFDKGNVYFCAYCSGYEIPSLKIFEPPLLIRPTSFSKDITCTSILKTWNEHTSTFIDEQKTTVAIRKIRDIRLRNSSGQMKRCSLVQMKLCQDAVIAYGERNLIVPDAVFIQQTMLFDDQAGIIAEWGLKQRRVQNADDMIQNRLKETIIELTMYGRNM